MPGAVPFRSTPEDEREVCGVRGMAVRRGVTIIAGGGYSGKSTLLDAIAAGHPRPPSPATDASWCSPTKAPSPSPPRTGAACGIWTSRPSSAGCPAATCGIFPPTTRRLDLAGRQRGRGGVAWRFAAAHRRGPQRDQLYDPRPADESARREGAAHALHRPRARAVRGPYRLDDSGHRRQRRVSHSRRPGIQDGRLCPPRRDGAGQIDRPPGPMHRRRPHCGGYIGCCWPTAFPHTPKARAAKS